MKLLSDFLFGETVEQPLFFLLNWYNKMNRLANSTGKPSQKFYLTALVDIRVINKDYL